MIHSVKNIKTLHPAATNNEILREIYYKLDDNVHTTNIIYGNLVSVDTRLRSVEKKIDKIYDSIKKNQSFPYPVPNAPLKPKQIRRRCSGGIEPMPDFSKYAFDKRYFHNEKIWNDPNLSFSEKVYLEEVWREERPFIKSEWDQFPKTIIF